MISEHSTFIAMPVNQTINTPIAYLPFEMMDKSVSRYRRSDLYSFLVKLFREEIAGQLCTEYFIGTNREGYTAFWQVDIDGNVRQCKIIQYLQDGHRKKATG